MSEFGESEETVIIEGKLPASLIYSWHDRHANLRISQYTNLLSGLRQRTAYGREIVECCVDEEGTEIMIDITDSAMFRDDFFVNYGNRSEDHPLVVAHRLKMKELKGDSKKILFSHRETIEEGTVTLKRMDDIDSQAFRIIRRNNTSGEETDTVAAIEMESNSLNFVGQEHGQLKTLSMPDRMDTTPSTESSQEPQMALNELSVADMIQQPNHQPVFQTLTRDVTVAKQEHSEDSFISTFVEQQTVVQQLSKRSIVSSGGSLTKALVSDASYEMSRKVKSRGRDSTFDQTWTDSQKKTADQLVTSEVHGNLPGTNDGLMSAFNENMGAWYTIKIGETAEIPSVAARLANLRPTRPSSLSRAIAAIPANPSDDVAEQALALNQVPIDVEMNYESLGKRDFEFFSTSVDAGKEPRHGGEIVVYEGNQTSSNLVHTAKKPKSP